MSLRDNGHYFRNMHNTMMMFKLRHHDDITIWKWWVKNVYLIHEYKISIIAKESISIYEYQLVFQIILNDHQLAVCHENMYLRHIFWGRRGWTFNFEDAIKRPLRGYQGNCACQYLNVDWNCNLKFPSKIVLRRFKKL